MSDANRTRRMRVLRGASRILWYESIGFVFLIVLAWIDEFEGSAQVLFGGAQHTRDWRDSALQTLVIVYIWAIVWGLTRKLIERVHDLGTFLKLCAWCRKVGHNGKWMKLENYFAEDFQIPTTHGMCPECKRMMEEETAQYLRIQRGESGRPQAPG